MYVFGAVDHAAAVASVGRFLGYRVTVCDARSKFVTPERFPDVDELVVEWPDQFLSARPWTSARSSASSPRPQVRRSGAQGRAPDAGRLHRRHGRSRRTTKTGPSACGEGVSDEDIARIHAPIGLKIGSRTPEEVAVAIAPSAGDALTKPRPGVMRLHRPKPGRSPAAEEVLSAPVAAGRAPRSAHPRKRAQPKGLRGHSFEVAAPPEREWDPLLMDVPRIVPCMPGATLDEVVDDSNWKATMQVKLGPIGLTFATDVERKEVDEANRRVVLGANARETRNRGRASATIESSLAPTNGGTKVDLVTDLSLSGTVAQYGRGMIEDISSQMVTELRAVPSGPARRIRRGGGAGCRRPGEADLRVLTLLRQPLAPHPMDRKEVELTQVAISVERRGRSAEVEPRQLLVYFLREQLGLTGTVVGCDTSSCGACTVLLDGESVKSCTVLAVQADGHEVTTIEGIGQNGDLHPVQQAFHENHGLQCGYCTPGMVLATVSLLEENPSPSEEEIRHALEGNLCRCTGYHNIVKAVQAAAPRGEGRWQPPKNDLHRQPRSSARRTPSLLRGETRWVDNLTVPGCSGWRSSAARTRTRGSRSVDLSRRSRPTASSRRSRAPTWRRMGGSLPVRLARDRGLEVPRTTGRSRGQGALRGRRRRGRRGGDPRAREGRGRARRGRLRAAPGGHRRRGGARGRRAARPRRFDHEPLPTPGRCRPARSTASSPRRR